MRQQLTEALTAEFPDCDVQVERRKGVIYCAVRKFIPTRNDTLSVAFALSSDSVVHSPTQREALTKEYVKEARKQFDTALAA